MTKKNFLFRNSLSIVLIALMMIFLSAQLITGWHTDNEQRMEDGRRTLALSQYVQSGHFIQATFENWESEFLQMMLYVVFTVFLRQQGSSESKGLEGEEDVDRAPKAHPGAPWPVKKGGIWLALYKHSLSIAFALLFILSFLLHLYGSLKENNTERLGRHLLPERWQDYITGSRFWFESFQNWQSEFLAVASLVLLSIWLRQKGSPESKPVDMAHDETP